MPALSHSLRMLALLGLVIHAYAQDKGIAATYNNDSGLINDPAVLFFDDFESKTTPFLSEHRSMSQLAGPGLGRTVLASHSKSGKHLPWDQHHPIKKTETVYYRFYSMFESGYDIGGGIKGPGLGAVAKGRPGGKAGIKPQGSDRYSARVCFNKRLEPYVYYYHMDMGRWGSNANQNIGTKISLVPGTWYCIEMMLKPNSPDKQDGELKLWINGRLKMHTTNIRWRTVSELQTNWVNHSAYFGGNWTSPKDQTRYEDNMVVANAYIGPLGKSPKQAPEQQFKQIRAAPSTHINKYKNKLQPLYQKYIQQLQKETDAHLESGKSIHFIYSLLKKEILITRRHHKGYVLQSEDMVMTIDIWEKFNNADAASLAIALSKKGSEESYSIAAYFVALHKGPAAARSYLAKSGTYATEIKSLLK